MATSRSDQELVIGPGLRMTLPRLEVAREPELTAGTLSHRDTQNRPRGTVTARVDRRGGGRPHRDHGSRKRACPDGSATKLAWIEQAKVTSSGSAGRTSPAADAACASRTRPRSP